MGHNWDFATILQNWPVLWVGIKGTVFIFVITVILGLGGGLIVGKKSGLAPTQEVAGGKLERFAIAGAAKSFGA